MKKARWQATRAAKVMLMNGDSMWKLAISGFLVVATLGAVTAGSSAAPVGTAAAGPAAARQDLAAPAPAERGAAAAAPAPYVDSTAIIANPERGLFDHDGTCDANPFDEERLKSLRREQAITLVRCIFYLEGYQARPLDTPVFDKLNDRVGTVKRLGLKLVLRFAYSEHSDLDANITMVETHISQLAPFLQANDSVIHVLESGFIGKFGEGYYTHQKSANGSLTDSYGDQGTISDAQWKLRKGPRQVSTRVVS